MTNSLQNYLSPQALAELRADKIKARAAGPVIPGLAPLLDWQRRVVDEATRFNVVCVGRRAGKTQLGIHLCADRDVLGYPVGWFSPSYKLMLEVWREVVQTFAPVIVRQNATERRMEFTTGGVLEFWSLDNPQAGRGRKYRRVIVDEAAFVPTLLDAWNYAIRPTLADLRGDGWIFSTPKGRNGFWQLWQRGQDEMEPDWRSWQMPSEVNPLIPPGELDEMRRQLPEMVRRQELDAEFLDDAGGVFRQVMDAATAEPQERGHLGHEYIMGIDWAYSSDYTAVTVLDIGTRSLVYLDRFNGVDYTMQRERIAAIADRFRPQVIISEANAMGRPNNESLRSMGLEVMDFTTTSASKDLIIGKLAGALERGDIRILPDPVLISELQAYEGIRQPGGGVKYGAPEGCFVSGTLIHMSDGCTLPIEMIEYGNAVITHTGQVHKVNKQMEREYEGDVYVIRASGLPDNITATPEHPFWAKARTAKHLQRRAVRKEFPPEWIRADELRKGDWLAIPKRVGLPRTELSPDRLYTIGYWLAEGHIKYGWNKSPRGLCFTTSEKGYLERVGDVLREWFPIDIIMRGNDRGVYEVEKESSILIQERGGKPGQTRPVYEMTFYSRPASQYFLDNFGQYAHGKSMSPEFFNQSGLLPIVSGHLDGDGSQRKNQQMDVNVYTSSEALAWQLRQIMIDNGIWCTFRRSSRQVGNVSGGKVTNYRSNILNIKASYLHLLYPCKVTVPERRHLRHVQEDDSYFYTPIREIETMPYRGKVYNFSVDEDNSYIAGGVAVHNCHDDTVMALAFAWHGAETSEPPVLAGDLLYEVATPSRRKRR